MAVIPGTIISIVGDYECHLFDNTSNKNDWHYVTISKVNNSTLRWTNRAGVSWTLTTIPDKTKLTVGSDCPYFNSGYTQVTVVWDGDRVSGLTGPSNEIYNHKLTDSERTKNALNDIQTFLSMGQSIVSIMRSPGLDQNQIIDAQFAADAMTAQCQDTIAHAHVLGMDLDRLFSAWNQFSPDMSNVIAELQIRAMLMTITATTKAMANFKADTVSLQIAVNELIGDLNGVTSVLNGRLIEEETAVANIKGELNRINERIRHLQSELSGSDGFWTGFSEGITLGIYHPVDDNLDEQ